MKKRLSLALVLSVSLPILSMHAQAEVLSYQAAMQLKQDNRAAEAEAAFAEIVKQEPNNLAAIEQLAIVQSWQNKFDLAVGNFKRALNIDASYSSARLGLARVSYWQGERAVALTEIGHVLEEQPAVADNWILKGDILMTDAQPGQAREAYLKAKPYWVHRLTQT